MENCGTKAKSGERIPVFVPNAVENEEKLNEDAAKGEDATHHYTRDGFGEEGLLRDLTGDLVCSHWLLNCLHRSKLTHLVTNQF